MFLNQILNSWQFFMLILHYLTFSLFSLMRIHSIIFQEIPFLTPRSIKALLKEKKYIEHYRKCLFVQYS